jgi:hypothetical protein
MSWSWKDAKVREPRRERQKQSTSAESQITYYNPTRGLVNINNNESHFLDLFEIIIDGDGLGELWVQCVLNFLGLTHQCPGLCSVKL